MNELRRLKRNTSRFSFVLCIFSLVSIIRCGCAAKVNLLQMLQLRDIPWWASLLFWQVRACGLWGSEPFRAAALDLSSRGCLKVNGLAADTCYSFRLERRAESSSLAVPPLAADLSDDEGSCPLSAATVGANSTGESSADQLGADVADGASALTGLDGSGGGGGGGGSTCSEGCTTVLTDESQRQEGQASYCTSSTRAVAGRHSRPSGTDRHTNNRMEFQWPSMGGRDRVCGTSEDFVSGRVNGAIVAAVSVATPPEVPFMLDAEGCGPNLRLTNSNLTVTNTGRKKWSAVRSTRGFACGVHRWKVRIDRLAGVVSVQFIKEGRSCNPSPNVRWS